jgi:hypothetical protein
MTIESEVALLLRKYRVQKHYRASREARATKYAVFDQSGQLTEPKRSGEARADADRLTAAAIVEYLKGRLV